MHLRWNFTLSIPKEGVVRMLAVTYPARALAKCLVTFWKGRKTWRIQRKSLPTSPYRVRRLTIFLLGSVILGWFLLHATHGTQMASASVLHVPADRVSTSFQEDSLGINNEGERAGGGPTNPALLAAAQLCNPFDTACVANSFASWAASSLMGAFSPLTDGVLKDPVDIMYQTPPTDSYSNPVIMSLNETFVGVLDAALACLLLIGAYNVIWGHHLRMTHTSVTEMIPRAILVVGAVHFNLLFLGMFVDFANELSLAVIHVASYHLLTNVIQGLLTNSTLSGLLLMVLVIVLGILVVLLLIQRIGTIALIALLLGIAPLGLACFFLPQTMRWGRLWLSMLSSALVTQVLQVITLALGGMFITSLGLTSLFHIDQGLANAFLAIGMMLLVLKIPQMLSTWALHPAADGSSAPAERSEDASSSSGERSDMATSSLSSTDSSTTTSTSLLTGSDTTGFTGTSSATSGGTTAAAAGSGGESMAAAAMLV
jgi:hypothetical protein